MDTAHFVFDTKAMIKHVCVGDMWVGVSYAMSLHKTESRNNNHEM